MYLSGVLIENYRGIHKAKLSFNANTVIIGENECGKSSILEAIQIFLNPIYNDSFPEFKTHQFHYPPEKDKITGPIHIVLTFRERSIGEWEGTSYDRISFLIKEKSNTIREIKSELIVTPLNEGKPETNWRIGSERSNSFTSDPEILFWLRHVNPTIYLSAGMLTGHGFANVIPEDNSLMFSSLSEGIRNYVKSILECSSSIISDRSTDIRRDIEKGYNAAFRLIESIDDQSNIREYGLGRKINEILGTEKEIERGNLTPILSEHGSTSQRLGVLLLVAALLRAGTVELLEDMEPIWIIENPEANLHPMTLASIRILIDGIKWQKIISTFSGTILNSVPLSQIRKLSRHKGIVREHRINEGIFSREDLRRISYHLQTQHHLAIFARMWLLVEGESEFWIIPQLSRLLNYDFALEGIVCMDFAQSGMTAIIKMAQELGIEWHLLADGDSAGYSYIASARKLIPDNDKKKRWTQLNAKDIEHFFWDNGYSDVYFSHARIQANNEGHIKPSRIIQRAVKNYSKPYLALSIVKSVAEPGSPGVPEKLKKMIKYSVRLAREAPENTSVLI